jgi:OOP family OmpA-OmpF porin
VDATNFNDLGSTTAPGASNLAGIVVDQGLRKVYAVDRDTNHLYVYAWDPSVNTLTMQGESYVTLRGVTAAYGLALDEKHGLLYVADRTTATVRYYSTSAFNSSAASEAGHVTPIGTTQTAMGIAIDTRRGFLYTGNAYPGYGSLGQLVKVNLDTGETATYTLPTAATIADNIVGVAVDEDTGNVYVTTGNQGSGGTDTLMVFDQNLNRLKSDLGDLGGPTGIAIPRTNISYNPLNFSKTASASSVESGKNLSYQLCYDNRANEGSVSSTAITDTLPAGTTFVSATGPYTVSGGVVTWNIGSVPGGATQVCYSLTVKVTAAGGETLLNSATISGVIGEVAVPTTQTVTTDVETSATPSSVGGTVQGEGGGGGLGLMEVALGAVAAAVVAWRRRRQTGGAAARVLLAAGAVGGMAALADPAQAMEPGWYVGAGAGHMRARTSAADLQGDLNDMGYIATVDSLENSDTGGQLFAGYRFTPNWAVEVAYVDLGTVKSVTQVATVTQSFVDDMAKVHPISIRGLALTGVAIYPIGRFSVFGKGGLVNWAAKANCASVDGAPVGELRFTGTDLTYGLGVGYEVGPRWSIRGEWERFHTSRNRPEFYALSLVYHF